MFGPLAARLMSVSPLKIEVAALNNSYKAAQLSSDESVSDGQRVNRASWQELLSCLRAENSLIVQAFTKGASM